MKMLEGTESIKATQLKEFGNAVVTLSREIESVHSVPLYNIKSHQLLYLEEIFTQKVSKD